MPKRTSRATPAAGINVVLGCLVFTLAAPYQTLALHAAYALPETGEQENRAGKQIEITARGVSPTPFESTRVTAGESNPGHTDWRYTRQGWKRIAISDPVKKTHLIRVPPHQPLSVHPIQISMLILLSAFGMIAWASDEWDWARLIHEQ